MGAITAQLAQMFQASLHQVVLALKCPETTLFEHRAADERKHMGDQYRARFNRILKNVKLDDEQFVRSPPNLFVTMRMACRMAVL